MLSEERRQAYLSAMGIDVLYPRQPLPGARPSPVYELPAVKPATDSRQLASTAAQTRQPAVKNPSHSANLQSVRESLGGVGKAQARKPVAETAEGDPVTAATNATPEQPAIKAARTETRTTQAPQSLQFRLRYWSVSEQLGLLAEEPIASANMQQEYPALLKAILVALELETPTHSEEFVWPFSAAMPASEAGADKAAQALRGFITKRLERDKFANLLVFSSQLLELLPEAQAHQDLADYQLASNVYLTRTHSLGAMLQVPELKREVWAQLQPLRKRLQSGK